MDNQYKCESCKEIWGFFQEDYVDEKDYPTICPLCTMPIPQMVRDTFKEGGIREVIKMMRLRFLKTL